ncbi:hypothetical protein LEP1GSC036_1616 [Leptospira weilii str. 2006001853]|uniref:Uncharacterized protein n=2 Tax=Leptospira weilii TaxID=28184 RepID=A0A828YWE9_9LEPT|nr:hypothetical protein LEP1GSC036_1616 [Leptospira weilii str. 2006001853]EMJ63266.1 hypothetical protein LEP1GSC051_2017 [Leptospira sp. P2653]EMN42512.1 hypothetical protein LEP1GSC086_1449 [Leptospira weilii str. LNT 1234]EMY14602.1 hypothetical protein LEP1GSC043_4036 [Leptospira weilii str. Ecochallenge]
MLEFVLTIKDHVKGAVKEEYLIKDKNEKRFRWNFCSNRGSFNAEKGKESRTNS